MARLIDADALAEEEGGITMAKEKTRLEIAQAAAQQHRQKADENYIAYQTTGVGRYDTQYYKHDCIAEAMEKYLVAIKHGAGYSISTRKFKKEPSHWTKGHWSRNTCGVRYWAELPSPPKEG